MTRDTLQVKLMKYFGDAPADNVDTEALGVISDFVQQFTKVQTAHARACCLRPQQLPPPPPSPQVLAEVSAIEKKKLAAEAAKGRREALQLQRARAAAAAAVPQDPTPSPLSRGCEVGGGMAAGGFASPPLGPKAQAAVDSARCDLHVCITVFRYSSSQW